MFSHARDYYSKYGPGAQHYEAEFRRGAQDKLKRSSKDKNDEKAKNNEKAKNEQRSGTSWERLVDGTADAPRVRLSADGELSDSFIDDAYNKQSH